MSSCVCKISFKYVQVCGGYCKMFRGLTFLGHSVYILRLHLVNVTWPFITIMTHGRPWRVDHSIVINVTWRRFDQSAKQLIVGHTTIKHDDPRLKMSHSLACIMCAIMMLMIVLLYRSVRWVISGPAEVSIWARVIAATATGMPTSVEPSTASAS